MPKKYTNKMIYEKLEKIEEKISISGYETILYALIGIALVFFIASFTLKSTDIILASNMQLSGFVVYAFIVALMFFIIKRRSKFK